MAFGHSHPMKFCLILMNVTDSNNTGLTIVDMYMYITNWLLVVFAKKTKANGR